MQGITSRTEALRDGNECCQKRLSLIFPSANWSDLPASLSLWRLCHCKPTGVVCNPEQPLFEHVMVQGKSLLGCSRANEVSAEMQLRSCCLPFCRLTGCWFCEETALGVNSWFVASTLTLVHNQHRGLLCMIDDKLEVSRMRTCLLPKKAIINFLIC